MRILSVNLSLLENYTGGDLPLTHKKKDYLSIKRYKWQFDSLSQLDYLRPIQTGKK